ncbi:unnamed protein product [Phytomonas sp. Hart1]|nr:unnamed protein product [Phytomonas sp. Hart1]|eukprot:CCW70342.1 unnamed protein product [Phytomonas sp. isolate Hart1]
MPISFSSWNDNRPHNPPVVHPSPQRPEDWGFYSKDDGRTIGRAHVADVNLSFAINGVIRAAACVNERIIWTAEDDGGLWVRSLPKGTVLKHVDMCAGTFCSCLLYVALQHHIWVAFENGSARVYDAATCALISEFVVNPNSRLGQSNKIHVMVEVEGYVFIGCEDACIVKRNALDSHLECILKGHKGAVRALAIYVGPTGSVVFSGSNDGSVKGWDPYRNKNSADNDATDNVGCIHTFKTEAPRSSSMEPHGAIRALEVVPHTNRIWSGGDDHAVRVWNLETLNYEAVLQGVHAAPVTCLLTLESRMWTGDAQGCILLWDMASLAILQNLSSRERLDSGELWFIMKIQPATSWKVWTAGAKGCVQCWNAETSPILFHDSRTGEEEKAQSTGRDGSGRLSKTEPWALVLQNDRENLPCDIIDVARLGFDLACGRGRLRIQHELQIHQLLEEENAFLKKRVYNLETARAMSLRSQDAQPSQSSKSPIRTSEDDIVSILRHEREIIEKELELLRDENYALLRLLEQHTESREKAKYIQKGVSQTVVGHRVKSESTQGDAPLGNATLSTSRSPSPSAQMHESSEHAGALRDSSRWARQMARDPEDCMSKFGKTKNESLQEPPDTESCNSEIRDHTKDNLSILRNQCNGYRTQIKRLVEEKEELQRALTNSKQKKMYDLKLNDNTQGMTNRASSGHKDISTRLEHNEVASLREELAKVKLISSNKTEALLKLQKELNTLKCVEETHSRHDAASQSVTPLRDSHADVSHEEHNLTPSPTRRTENTVRSSATSSNDVDKGANFSLSSRVKHQTTVPQDEDKLSPEAWNLALSVRLTDAESVITELESLLNGCMNQLAEERETRHHLEQKISVLQSTNV